MKRNNKLVSLVVAGFASFGLITTPLAVAAAESGSTVDPNHDVSFKIIKYKGEVGDTSTPLGDIVFKIQKVNTQNQLTTNEGWQEVAGLTAATACDTPRSCETGFEVTTAADGSVTVTKDTNPNFTVGVYKITEQTKTGYTAAAPFLITLPYTKDGTWNYDLTAKPKNQVLNPTKTVKDTGATADIAGTNIGNIITYTVNVPVPADPVGEFKIEDTFPAGLTPVEVENDGVAVASDPSDILATEDYEATIAGQKITVTIKASGQNKLKEARKNNPSLKLVLTLKGTVTTFPTADMNRQFANQADIYYPNRTEPVKTSSDTNFDPTADGAVPSPTLTKYVDVKITKQGETDEAVDMSDAQFEIYVCVKEGETLKTKGNALKAATSATGTDQGTTFTTANPDTATKTATVTAYNLQDPRFRNGAQLAEPVIYCVLETKAPNGFVRDPNPREVTFEANATTGKVTVVNQKETILSNLPLTGATGVYVLLGAGSVMVIIGLLLFLKRRKCDDEEQLEQFRSRYKPKDRANGRTSNYQT